MVNDAIRITDVKFRWKRDAPLTLNVNLLEVRQGERVFISGPSGSGKTTLLNLLGGIIVPEAGCVEIGDTVVSDLSGNKRDRFRADHIGFIFQMFNLIPFLSALDNICLPCRFSKNRLANALKTSPNLKAEAERLLRHMGLDLFGLADKAVNRLSVGQQQRIAVARSLIGGPKLIIADEPTSALDAETRKSFLDLLFREIENTGAALLFVSHDRGLAPYFDRSLALAEINQAPKADR